MNVVRKCDTVPIVLFRSWNAFWKHLNCYLLLLTTLKSLFFRTWLRRGDMGWLSSRGRLKNWYMKGLPAWNLIIYWTRENGCMIEDNYKREVFLWRFYDDMGYCGHFIWVFCDNLMNYNYGVGYNQPYVQQEVITVNTYGGRPYYQQPMIVQPQPQVVIVEDRYAQNNIAATEAALCAWCCCMELLCCCLLWSSYAHYHKQHRNRKARIGPLL